MEFILQAILIIGIISFSAAGAMVAIDKENDLFGVILMSLITCFAGGILRDVLAGHAIGRDMPQAFYAMNLEIIVCIIASLIVFFIAMALKERYVKEEATVEKINNILDALGLGVFTAAGTGAYMELGVGIAVLMGVLTAVGGSLTRDVILREIPAVLRKRIYAVACIGGGLVYYGVAGYIMKGMESADVVATISCVIFIFTVRICATAFKWDMPKAIDFAKIKAKEQNEESSDI